MDRYPDRVPIQTQKVGSIYNDKVYYELLSSINSINGRPCEGEVRKDMLHDGDYVTYTFRSKEFSGVVMAAGLQTLEPPNPAQPQEQQNAASKQQVQESSPPQQPAKDILRTASGRKITKRSPAKHSSQAPEKSPAKHSSTATEKSPSKRSSTENKKGKSPVKLSSTAHSPPAKRARTGQSTASKKSLKKGELHTRS